MAINAKDDFVFRIASRDDVVNIVRLLADDPLGAKRERYQDPLPSNYYDAFSAIDADPNNELVVACNNEQVVGVLQLTFIPYLTYQGGWRALIEGVRVDATLRPRAWGARCLNGRSRVPNNTAATWFNSRWTSPGLTQDASTRV